MIWTALKLDMGDLPTWVSAVAAIFALLAASIAAFMAYRLYKVELDRDEKADRERADAEASQARLVFSEPEWPPTRVKSFEADGTTFYTYGFKVKVHNYGDGVITNVKVVYVARQVPGDGFEWKRHEVPAYPAATIRVAPGKSEDVVVSVRDEVEWDLERIQVCLTYTDSRGYRWDRWNDEQPQRRLQSSKPGPSHKTVRLKTLWFVSPCLFACGYLISHFFG